jgi:hypothetical protein
MKRHIFMPVACCVIVLAMACCQEFMIRTVKRVVNRVHYSVYELGLCDCPPFGYIEDTLRDSVAVENDITQLQ